MSIDPARAGSPIFSRLSVGNAVPARARPSIWSPLFVLTLAVIPAILAIRKLYIAPDDLGYIVYFSNENSWLEQLLNASDWWLTIIEEPLWNIYTITIGMTIGAEEAFRVTIFLGAFLFLYCSAKLSGSWSTTALLFVFSTPLAPQMYFNQVRQGIA